MPSNGSEKSLVNNHFSHIYIEKQALEYPDSKRIVHKYPNAIRVIIGDYKEVFNRPHQRFQFQKRSMNLILAVKKDNFLYSGSTQAPDFGHRHFYYNSLIMNCFYNCDYCYLQGMYPSANIVVFVNNDDFIAETKRQLAAHPMYLCISYDTDLLAFEKVVPFCSRWIEFARDQSDLKIELRTKSSNYKAIAHLKPSTNVILAWTVSPQEIIEKYEKETPSLKRRLEAIGSAIKDGWNVRLCFDPLLRVDRWQSMYAACIDQTFRLIPADKLHDISVGVFRMNSDYLSRITKQRTNSDILYYPFEKTDGTVSYPQMEREEMTQFLLTKLEKYNEKEKIFI